VLWSRCQFRRGACLAVARSGLSAPAASGVYAACGMMWTGRYRYLLSITNHEIAAATPQGFDAAMRSDR